MVAPVERQLSGLHNTDDLLFCIVALPDVCTADGVRRRLGQPRIRQDRRPLGPMGSETQAIIGFAHGTRRPDPRPSVMPVLKDDQRNPHPTRMVDLVASRHVACWRADQPSQPDHCTTPR